MGVTKFIQNKAEGSLIMKSGFRLAYKTFRSSAHRRVKLETEAAR